MILLKKMALRSVLTILRITQYILLEIRFECYCLFKKRPVLVVGGGAVMCKRKCQSLCKFLFYFYKCYFFLKYLASLRSKPIRKETSHTSTMLHGIYQDTIICMLIRKINSIQLSYRLVKLKATLVERKLTLQREYLFLF